MEKLIELREEIDEIDKKIVDLYERRMTICEQVGEYKIDAGRKIFDKQREKEKLLAVTEKVADEFHKKGISELFEQLMSMSRKLQYQLLTKKGALGRLPFIGVDTLDIEGARVVFQGTEGAYSQAAMEKYFGKNLNSYHVQTFRDAMEAIEEGSADFAVLPIENSSAGVVNEVYDLLMEFENYIVGEVFLPIDHTLAGLPGTKLSDIERVYSHPQALMQSAKFLASSVVSIDQPI
jgi:chorismate mutase/prephenate dehydratase